MCEQARRARQVLGQSGVGKRRGKRSTVIGKRLGKRATVIGKRVFAVGNRDRLGRD